jgi:hypothetical protein
MRTGTPHANRAWFKHLEGLGSRCLQKDWLFPVKLSKSGPDKSKSMVLHEPTLWNVGRRAQSALVGLEGHPLMATSGLQLHLGVRPSLSRGW